MEDTRLLNYSKLCYFEKYLLLYLEREKRREYMQVGEGAEGEVEGERESQATPC